MSSLPDTQFSKIFSHSLGCLFTFLMVSLEAQTFIILMMSSLCIFSFVAYTFGVIYKIESLSSPISWRFTPVFSSRSFKVLALTLKSLIHFEFCFFFKYIVQIPLHVAIHLPQHHLLKSQFPHWIVLAPLSKSTGHRHTWVCFWTLQSVPLTCKFILMAGPQCLDAWEWDPIMTRSLPVSCSWGCGTFERCCCPGPAVSLFMSLVSPPL